MSKSEPAARGAPALEPGVAEMRALAHPLRLRILELFAEAPRTTKQVADLLGQPPTRLYHHVAALERAGLLRLKETRQNRGTTEKWYEAIARTMGSTLPTSEGASPRKKKNEAAARRAVAMAVLEQSQQEVVAAMALASKEPPLVARLVLVAPPRQINALRQRLYAVVKDVQREFGTDDEGEKTDDYARWAMTVTFAPVTSR
jgi:DNA-binding transcriptional ArsR family regulator